MEELKKRYHSEETKQKIRESAFKRKKPHHRTHGFSSDCPNLYNVWQTMKNRCRNPKREKYKDYGARGIKVCEEWQDAKNFCEWALQSGYADGMQIDRIDVNGNYEPSNCRWVTPKVNSRNRRNTVYLTVEGETKSVAEWCETIDISPYTIYWWVRCKGRDYAEKRIEEQIRIAS